jgi:putative DNA primase/helicase
MSAPLPNTPKPAACQNCGANDIVWSNAEREWLCVPCDEPVSIGARAGTPARTLPAPSAPMEVARALVDERYTHPSGALTLRHWRGGWWEWATTRWVELEARAVTAVGYAFTETAVYTDAKGDVKPWAPNRHKIGDPLEALAAVVHLPESVPMPSWLDGRAYDGLLVSCANGLLDVGARALLDHDPRFFNSTSVPFA